MTHSVTSKQFMTFEDLFDYYNHELFRYELPSVMINMSRKKRTYGFFAPKRWMDKNDGNHIHEISMNPDALNRNDIEWQSTLVHEMVHLWQMEYGHYSGSYHNKEWANKMIEIGLMPSHTGEPGGNKTGQNMTHYVIEGGAFERAFKAIQNENFDNMKMPFVPNDKIITQLTTKKGTKSKNGVKVKYTCACGNNVWGRPDLDIMCNECEEIFEPNN